MTFTKREQEDRAKRKAEKDSSACDKSSYHKKMARKLKVALNENEKKRGK